MISVVMPVYNASAYLADAVNSILKQAGAELEFVIIDDGSTDNSLAILQGFADADSRVRLVSRPNTGYSVALNEGLALARGTYVARMDADDISLPGRLKLQADFLDAHPDCVVVGGRILAITPDNIPVAESLAVLSHEDIDGWHLNNAAAAIAHPTAMIRREALVAVGGYRTAFEPAEDLDLWLRLGERGQLANVNDLVLRYRLHANSVSYTRFAQQQQHSFAAIAEARQRRGLPAMQVPTPTWSGKRIPEQTWARMAWASGNFKMARRLSARALRKAPGSSETWRVATLAWLGPVAPMAVSALRAIGLTRNAVA